MTQPNVTMNELDGGLGILPPSAAGVIVIAGPATSGPLDTPVAHARVSLLVAQFGAGSAVELAAYHIERFGKTVIFIRTGATTVGTATAVTKAGGGTSVGTVTGATPNDDYEAVLVCVAGGTIATPGITFQWSLDGGRTLSPITALLASTSFVFPGAGGVTLSLAAGTIQAGDSYSFRTTSPAPTSTELGTALDALRATTQPWRMAYVTAPLDATFFDLLETKFAGMAAIGKYRSWMASFRMPTPAESESAYKTAFDTALSAKVTVSGYVCAGAVEVVSGVSGRKYRRPIGFVVGPRQAVASEEENIAVVAGGALVGVQLTDSNGNPKHHDETLYPGLDDSRAITLRTIEGRPGVFVNRPRIFSSPSSDFQIAPHREVMNLGKAVIRNMLIDRLNRPVRVDKKTGFILEADALEIESLGREAMREALLAKPKVSAIAFIVSRTDNLLASKTMNTQARIVPLAYPEYINSDVGYTNPALQVVTV